MTAPDEFLAPIRERAEAYASHGTPGLHAPQDRARLLAALDGVLALHVKIDDGRWPMCSCCWYWPCPTVKAITTALEGQG